MENITYCLRNTETRSAAVQFPVGCLRRPLHPTKSGYITVRKIDGCERLRSSTLQDCRPCCSEEEKTGQAVNRDISLTSGRLHQCPK